MKKEEELIKMEVKKGNQYIEPYVQVGESKKEQIIRLRTTTFKTNTQIAKEVNCHRSYVSKVLDEVDLEILDKERVANVREEFLQILQNKIKQLKDSDNHSEFKTVILAMKQAGKFLGIEAPQQIEVKRDSGPKTVNIQINVKSREEADAAVKEIDVKDYNVKDGE